jgi:hypothetical protein
MASHNSLDVAKREMLSSIDQLPPDAQFAVIFYELKALTLTDPQGRRGLMSATAANKTRVRSQLARIAPLGVFFLTDADDMTNSSVNEILEEVGQTRIQAVEFGQGTDLGQRTPLSRLATTTGGTYLYIDVSKFPRSADGF